MRTGAPGTHWGPGRTLGAGLRVAVLVCHSTRAVGLLGPSEPTARLAASPSLCFLRQAGDWAGGEPKRLVFGQPVEKPQTVAGPGTRLQHG